MKWSDHSVKELRTVARAYKKHLSLGAPSKMTKDELVALLDKHLRIEDGTNNIVIRSQEEKPLMLSMEKVSKAKKGKKVAPPAPPPREPSPPPPAAPAAPAAPAVKKTKTKSIGMARMRMVREKALPQAKSSTVDASSIAAQAATMMQQLADAEKALAQAKSAVADAMAIKPPMMESEQDEKYMELLKDIDFIKEFGSDMNQARTLEFFLKRDGMNIKKIYVDEIKKTVIKVKKDMEWLRQYEMKRKRIQQAKSAVADAMAIKPPYTEQEYMDVVKDIDYIQKIAHNAYSMGEVITYREALKQWGVSESLINNIKGTINRITKQRAAIEAAKEAAKKAKSKK